jgi:hypothetical protein
MKLLIKIAALTCLSTLGIAQPITGSGTGSGVGGPIPRFNAANNITASNLYQNGVNVGLGTTTPTNPLHIQTTSSAGYGLLINQLGNGQSGINLWNTNSTTPGKNWGIWSTGPGNAGGAGNFIIQDVAAAQSRLFINGTTGNMLIGNQTAIAALAKLHVHDGALRLTGAVSGMGGPQLIWGGNATTAPNGEWAVEYETANPGFEGLNFWKPFGATGTAGNHFLFVSNTGKVGINSNNPTAQLTVNGNMLVGDPANVTLPTGYKLYVQTGILTEKVKVALTTNPTDWADYVFEKDYKLKTLEEVSSYVEKNKHLPGVPSTKELVEQGGIDLGKMSAKLMEKIEELTLYTIQLNEKNKELTERLSKLESSK